MNQNTKRNLLLIGGGALTVILVICIVLFSFIKYKEAQNEADLQRMQETAYRTQQMANQENSANNEYNPIDFDELWNTNSDIIAWVNVPGTGIDYPILQSGDDKEEDYYLDHNLDGSGGYPGSIYIQKVSNPDFSSFVSVVYGHNMKDGEMFANLHAFEDLKFFEDNREFIIYLPDDVKHYEIIAATKYDDRLIPAYYNSFASREDAMNFIGSVYLQNYDLNNHFIDETTLDLNGDYVVLSTCTSKSDTRYLVVGMLKK